MEKMTFKQAKQDDRFLRLSEGNNKLKSNKTTRFLIWNLQAGTTCPYATEACKAGCYAKKAETVYPDVLPARLENFEKSRDPKFADNMIFTISAYLDRKAYKEAEHIIIRVHESGDFYNRRYSEAWLKIAAHFSNDKRVVFMAYTKSFILFNGVALPSNFALRASVWADTDEKQLSYIARNGWPVYSAVDKFDAGNSTDDREEARTTRKAFRCRCYDCANCGACWDNSLLLILCEIH